MSTKGYLLDTNVISAVNRQGHSFHQKANAWLGTIRSDPTFISIVSIAEIEYGLQVHRPRFSPDEREKELKKFVAGYIAIDVDKNTSKVYGEIRADLFRKYGSKNSKNKVTTKQVENLRELTSARELGIQENDLWIVCTAVQYNLEFVTLDSGSGMKRIVDIANYDQKTTFLKS